MNIWGRLIRSLLKNYMSKDTRGVIFDIDNTLVPHGAPADERAKRLFQRLREIGFESCLLSNNQKKACRDV